MSIELKVGDLVLYERHYMPPKSNINESSLGVIYKILLAKTPEKSRYSVYWVYENSFATYDYYTIFSCRERIESLLRES